MRILYAAMRYDYGIEARGTSYEYENFYKTLIHMGYEVLEFDYMTLLHECGRDEMNRLLINAVHEFKPELLFCCLFTDQFDFATFDYITRYTNTITVNWFNDDVWRFDTYSRYWCRAFDYVATTDPASLEKYKSLGYENALLTQFACNNRVCAKLELPKSIDVSFIGQPHGKRVEVIQTLQRAGIHVECWGSGWANGKLSQEDMIKVFNQSKINLNFCASSVEIEGRPVYQMKARVFEVPGCSAFLLTDMAPGLEGYYAVGEELVCFQDTADLIRKIQYYTANEEERERIARRGYIKTNALHTYEKRFENLFYRILNAGKRKWSWT